MGDEGNDFDLGALLRVHRCALQHEPEQRQCERGHMQHYRRASQHRRSPSLPQPYDPLSVMNKPIYTAITSSLSLRGGTIIVVQRVDQPSVIGVGQRAVAPISAGPSVVASVFPVVAE